MDGMINSTLLNHKVFAKRRVVSPCGRRFLGGYEGFYLWGILEFGRMKC